MWNMGSDPDMYDDGTTATEILAVIIPSFFLTQAVTYLSTIYLKPADFALRFLLEFVVLVIPSVLICTILTDIITQVLTAFVTISVILSIKVYLEKPNKTKLNTNNAEPNLVVCKSRLNLSFITNARSTINILTGIAILAIDFNIFPGRFSKTKKYGFSLMDVGVGLFIYSNGIVAPEIRGYKNSFVKTIKSIIPLLVLGIARFIITRQINYHVNVSEYGLHWNFFITLAVTKFISSIMLMAIDINLIFIQGITLLIAHEIFLQMGIDNFVLGAKYRTTFLTANREGICSSLGYVALHFLSISIGKWLDIKNTEQKTANWKLFGKLIFTVVALALSTMFCFEKFNISRCLANSTYCLWILLIGVLMTTLYYMYSVFQDYIFPINSIQAPVIFEAINYNGLVYFLVSNLLTGFVNIVFQTRRINTMGSLLILFSYMLATCLLSVILYKYRIKIKL